jgi:hypothetical protein
MAEYRKGFTADERERMSRHVLTKAHADQSTMVHNILAERRSSRRNKVRQFNCKNLARNIRIRKRLRLKLAARELVATEENLTSRKNDPSAKKEDAQEPRKGPRKEKSESPPQKWSGWSQTKEMLIPK